MGGKTQINAERRGSFVEYPAGEYRTVVAFGPGRSHANAAPEIQSAIISALYTHSTKFPNYTAFLRTCKSLYYAVYPVFLAN